MCTRCFETQSSRMYLHWQIQIPNTFPAGSRRLSPIFFYFWKVHFSCSIFQRKRLYFFFFQPSRVAEGSLQIFLYFRKVHFSCSIFQRKILYFFFFQPSRVAEGSLQSAWDSFEHHQIGGASGENLEIIQLTSGHCLYSGNITLYSCYLKSTQGFPPSQHKEWFQAIQPQLTFLFIKQVKLYTCHLKHWPK